MGYESKIYIIDRHEHKKIDETFYTYGDKIMEIDLCKMGYGMYNRKSFTDLFTHEIDFDLWINGNPTQTDCYDEHCKYGDIDAIINWLNKMVKDTDYRRAKLFLAILKSIKKQIKDGCWTDIKIVHYGH